MKVKGQSQVNVKTVDNYPKQGNSYDCGVYALLGIEVVLSVLSSVIGGSDTAEYQGAIEKLQNSQVFQGNVSDAKAIEKRKVILATAHELIQKTKK